MSSIDRNLTHGEDILQPEFASNDFRSGWQVHQIVDHIQTRVRYELFLEFDMNPDKAWPRELWVIGTAMKKMQNMFDV